jgi:N-methylhydantoinase B
VRTDIQYLDPHSGTHVMVSGHCHRIRGFAGGHDGAPPQVRLRAGTPDEVLVAEVAFDVPMRDGDIIRFERGGGGWGPPTQRDGHRIAADLADGYITADGARRDYGYGGGGLDAP